MKNGVPHTPKKSRIGLCIAITSTHLIRYQCGGHRFVHEHTNNINKSRAIGLTVRSFKQQNSWYSSDAIYIERE